MIDLDELKKAKITTFTDGNSVKTLVDCSAFNLKEVIDALETAISYVDTAACNKAFQEWQGTEYIAGMFEFLRNFKCDWLEND